MPRVSQLRHPGLDVTLRRLGLIDGGLSSFGQHGAQSRRRLVGEAVDAEDAIDHVGGDFVERSALQLHGHDRPARVAAQRALSTGHTRRAPERRHLEPGGPRRRAETSSHLTEEESARFHPVIIARGYDSHAGER